MKPEYSIEDHLAWARRRAAICEADETMKHSAERYLSLVELLLELKVRRSS